VRIACLCRKSRLLHTFSVSACGCRVPLPWCRRHSRTFLPLHRKRFYSPRRSLWWQSSASPEGLTRPKPSAFTPRYRKHSYVPKGNASMPKRESYLAICATILDHTLEQIISLAWPSIYLLQHQCSENYDLLWTKSVSFSRVHDEFSRAHCCEHRDILSTNQSNARFAPRLRDTRHTIQYHLG
jgi:hypothetical protein